MDRPVGPHDDGPGGGRGGTQPGILLAMRRRIRDVAPAPDDDLARLGDCLIDHLVAFGPRSADGLLLGLHWLCYALAVRIRTGENMSVIEVKRP